MAHIDELHKRMPPFSLMDIAEVLTKGLCLEQIGSVTVLHLDTLNKRLFESLEKLSDTELREGEKHSTRLGPHLSAYCDGLYEDPPMFKGIDLRYRGRPNVNDKLSGIRKLQERAGKSLKAALRQRLELTKYEKACQCLLPTKQCKGNDYEKKLNDDITEIINANIKFVGDDSLRPKIEIGLKKLISFFSRSEFAQFTALEILDVYEMIWTERRFWEDIGPDAMAIIECVLADPISSANCERGGKVLKLILSIYRKNMYDLAVDEDMQVKTR